jgi:hypothetical protein
MKSVVLPSLLFVVGLAVGWLLKLGAEPVKETATVVKPAVPRVEAPAPEVEEPADPDLVAPPILEPQNFTPPVPMLGAQAEANVKLRDEAKLKRLVEALVLTDEQVASLVEMIEKVRTAPEDAENSGFPGPSEILGSLKATGDSLDAMLKAILTPEQLVAFGEMRKRQEENRVASRTSRELAEIQDMVDLTEGQRGLLRERLMEELGESAIPAEVALVLESSPLPLGAGTMNAQAVESLVLMKDAPASDDPRVAHLELIENQRRELDQKVERLKGILTPAQMLRYEAELANQRFILDQMAPPSP